VANPSFHVEDMDVVEGLVACHGEVRGQTAVNPVTKWAPHGLLDVTWPRRIETDDITDREVAIAVPLDLMGIRSGQDIDPKPRWLLLGAPGYPKPGLLMQDINDINGDIK
jgi:hypothetical protein